MNLVQLSEQLKDVPDNFLMMEVQNPSGSYPAYLIVSEMTRRKRMRENAPKQEPQTTVAEDLMGGGIRAMQPQMPQQMPQQMPGAAQAMASQMPQMPQQMPQEPQMMAGGGLVAFEQGGPVRAFDGMFTGDYTEDRPEIPRGEFIKELSLSELQEYNRTGKVPERLYSRFGKEPNVATSDPFLYFQPTTVATPDAYPPAKGNRQVPLSAIETPAATGTTQGKPSTGGAGQATRTSPGAEAMRIAKELGATSYPGYDMEAGIARLRQTMPDTASQAMADYIKRQEGQMEGQRASNLNMALMQAGLGMMGSKARSGIQGIAEGGLEGLRAYRQGVSELQKGEQQIELARMKMAEAKDARERGLYDLAMKEQATSMELFKQGQEAKFRGASVMATVDAGQQRAAGRTADLIPSPAEVKNVREQVQQALTAKFLNSGQKFDPNSPEFKNAVEQEIANQFAVNYGKIYRPMMMGAPAPQRGDFNTITAGS